MTDVVNARTAQAHRAVTIWLGPGRCRGFTARDSQLPGCRPCGRPGLADHGQPTIRGGLCLLPCRHGFCRLL